MRQLKLLNSACQLTMIAGLSACGGGADTPSQPEHLLAATGTTAASVRNITVALDGSGNYTNLQDAFSSVPDNNTVRTVITIKPGVYVGQAILRRFKHKVTLQGSDPTTTILSYYANVNEQPAGTDSFYKGYGIVIESNDFIADKLTFRNTSGDHGQAIALRINGDRALVTNSRMLGWQDTLNLNVGRHYIKDSYIEGRVDFIYGDGTSVFDNCEIKSKNGGYITASSAPDTRPYGFVIINSRLTSDPTAWVDPNSTTPVVPPKTPPQSYLGRPWRPYASVIYMNTDMGGHIKPAGWDNWGNAANELTARYAEYGNYGVGANTSARVTWAKQMTSTEASQVTLSAVLGGTDGWHPY
ncbi:MAG: pectinesterase family protein [Massilia sp.]